MTVDKPIADALAAHNGAIPGDERLPPYALIVEYTNAWGGTSYGCAREGNPYTPSNHVQNPRTYWQREITTPYYCHDDNCALYAQPQAPRWPFPDLPQCRACTFDAEPTPPDTSWMNETEEDR